MVGLYLRVFRHCEALGVSYHLELYCLENINGKNQASGKKCYKLQCPGCINQNR